MRLEDNTGLVFALKNSETVIPAFIFTQEQLNDNPYRSDHCIKFMLESLEDLGDQLREKNARLSLFKGSPDQIVEQCISTLNVDSVVVNRDYTPYSIQRDDKIKSLCRARDVAFYSFDDALLQPPENTLKSDGKPYAIFTPYFRNALKQTISRPVFNNETNYCREPISFAEDWNLLSKMLSGLTISNSLRGGRTEGLKILKKMADFDNYEELRDFPAEEFSTHLSPYLKFTVCSPREVYAELCRTVGADNGLVRSLYWRDFFSAIACFFPHVFKGAFQPKFDGLEWSQDVEAFQRWCEGTTGFPLVDAGMREMNQTGFMHNRVRMVVGSFLVKDLFIDWRWGEKYFARMLVDYDPAVNNGNWQWVASTGCDAQPYFRIFNPWSQQKKFDPDCLYIKKWIPELRDVHPKVINTWHEEKSSLLFSRYPIPIINHESASKKTLAAYRALH